MAEELFPGKLYHELLSSTARVVDRPRSALYEDDDDMEVLFGSEEIVKEQKKKKKKGERNDDHYAPGCTDIEEELHFKRFQTKHRHKYTESEMEKIRASCEATIVHDYAEQDIYHVSDEERRERDLLNEIRFNLDHLKRVYHRADQYVEAMRVIVKAWKILAQNNYIHSEEEFFRLVGKGKIYAPGLVMPMFKGIEDYNQDMIVQYISNPDVDASTLQPAKVIDSYDPFYDRYSGDFEGNPTFERLRLNIHEQWIAEGKVEVDEYPEDATDEEKAKMFTSEDLDEAVKDIMEADKLDRLMDDDELEFIETHGDKAPRMQIHNVDRKYIKGYDRRNTIFGKRKKKKKKKKLSKSEKMIRKQTHQMLNLIQHHVASTGSVAYGRSDMIASGLFSSEKEAVSPWDKIPFKGSWANKTDVFLNDLNEFQVMSAERSDHSHGYMTYADIRLQEFFSALEEAGVNVIELRRIMNCAPEDVRFRNDKKATKNNRKLEAALVKRLTKLNRDPKFKKAIQKAEKEVNEGYADY